MSRRVSNSNLTFLHPSPLLDSPGEEPKPTNSCSNSYSSSILVFLPRLLLLRLQSVQAPFSSLRCLVLTNPLFSQFMVRESCYFAEDYQSEITSFADPTKMAANDVLVQFPFVVPVSSILPVAILSLSQHTKTDTLRSLSGLRRKIRGRAGSDGREEEGGWKEVGRDAAKATFGEGSLSNSPTLFSLPRLLI